MEISIIIPIYNASKHLRTCLESIRNQTFREFEVLLVDDGSTDPSLNTCKAYQEQDSRFQVISKKKNEGVEQARLDGLALAKGKYIFFVDADDWIENDHILATMHQKAEETQADYVEIGMQRVFNQRKWIKKKRKSPITGFIQTPELFDTYYLSFFGKNLLSINIWGKLYRKSVIDLAKPQALGLSMGEDLAFNLQVFPYLKSIYILDTIGYNYRYGGITCQYNPHLYPDLRKLYLYKEEQIQKHQYTQALDAVRVEMTNVLYSDIMQHLFFHQRSEDEIKSRIKKQLEDPLWKKLPFISHPTPEMNVPFVQAIVSKDSEKIVQLCMKDTKDKWWTKSFDKIKNYILTHL